MPPVVWSVPGVPALANSFAIKSSKRDSSEFDAFAAFCASVALASVVVLGGGGTVTGTLGLTGPLGSGNVRPLPFCCGFEPNDVPSPLDGVPVSVAPGTESPPPPTLAVGALLTIVPLPVSLAGPLGTEIDMSVP